MSADFRMKQKSRTVMGGNRAVSHFLKRVSRASNRMIRGAKSTVTAKGENEETGGDGSRQRAGRPAILIHRIG